MKSVVVLERSEQTGYSLVKLGKGSLSKFAVGRGFDPETGRFEEASYYLYLEQAVVALNRITGRFDIRIMDEEEPAAPERDGAGVFCTVEWAKQDIEAVLADKIGAEWATPRNIEVVAAAAARPLRERSIEEGWTILEDLIYGYASDGLLRPRRPDLR